MKIEKIKAYDIRKLWQQGNKTQDELAEMFSCSRQYINQIVRNQQYNDPAYSYEKAKIKRTTAQELQKLYAKIAEEKANAQNKVREQKTKLSFLETLEKNIENQE